MDIEERIFKQKVVIGSNRIVYQLSPVAKERDGAIKSIAIAKERLKRLAIIVRHSDKP